MRSCRTTSSEVGGSLPRRELPLVESAYERLRGVAELTVCCHVPVLGRCVDLAYVRRGLLTTVEFKIRAWRRAIGQARDHRLAADYAYICLPARRVTDAMLGALGNAGVGLLFWRQDSEWPFETVVEAPRSDENSPVARSEVLKYVRASEGSAG